MKVVAFLAGRDESQSLPLVLQNFKAQTLRSSQIIFVDDASTDNSAEIAEAYGATVIKLYAFINQAEFAPFSFL